MNRGTEPTGRASVPSGPAPGPDTPPPPPPVGASGPPIVPAQPGPYQPPAGQGPVPPQTLPGAPGGPPGSPAGGSPAGPRPPAAGGRRSWPVAVALLLIGALTATVALQAWWLRSLSNELDRTTAQLEELTQGQAYGTERLDALEDRASELESLAGDVIDTEAVAAAVLPSVFMVAAGPHSGTAFAMGPSADGGGANLFTNFHVVEAVWTAGEREVTLQRPNQSYTAEIVDVEPGNDVALLRTSSSFNGLAATGEEARAGQPIIAVGAPKGLTDTVTSGVVSTPAQELDDGSGPWIQFDAAINPGNSGGPVIDSEQEVVGIATAKGRETEGIGFAVPIDVACGLFDVC